MKNDNLSINPSLAKAIGVKETVFLAALDKEIQKDGRGMIKATYEDLREIAPFLSAKTIVRIVRRLRDKNLIMVSDKNESPFDRTNWYAINYLNIEGEI